MKTKSVREYGAMVQQVSPRSPVLKNCLFAFLFGGAICAPSGRSIANPSSCCSASRCGTRAPCFRLAEFFSPAALTAFGVYDSIAKHAGAGTLVPITGFANSMVSPRAGIQKRGLCDRSRRKNVRRFRPGARFRHLGLGVLRRRSVRVIGLFQG